MNQHIRATAVTAVAMLGLTAGCSARPTEIHQTVTPAASLSPTVYPAPRATATGTITGPAWPTSLSPTHSDPTHGPSSSRPHHRGLRQPSASRRTHAVGTIRTAGREHLSRCAPRNPGSPRIRPQRKTANVIQFTLMERISRVTSLKAPRRCAA
jgi:hypothetical protein